MVELVWLKKDLRIDDHQALYQARQRGAVVALFVIEPQWLSAPDFSNRHLDFALECLGSLKSQLQSLNIPLWVYQGEVIQALSLLHRQIGIAHIHSHQETGSYWTYQRDTKVQGWAREQGIPWSEYLQFAVVRRLKSRDHWHRLRPKIIERPLYHRPSPQEPISFSCPWINKSWPSPSRDFSGSLFTGGREAGLRQLELFLSHRLPIYSKGMSSPLSAVDACSLLSPHITWGTLSMSELHQRIQQRRQHLLGFNDKLSQAQRQGLRSFESRLWWHCHFIQKLEDEPRLEFQCINPAYQQLRQNSFNKHYFESWCRGETGFPFIDACMRSLIERGWINFRMRAMLVSFATYQLWLDWPRVAQHLARLFVDLEPGIHYSQVQMQSGVTGINAIRIYSPIKQSQDQDPQGLFIKQFLPELEELDATSVHWPQSTPPLLRQLVDIKYPDPIVDPKVSYQQAKEKIFQFRQRPEVKALAQAVFKKHGSRKHKHFPRQKRD
jgi:deoxyribodipyrimidine photo-lyase